MKNEEFVELLKQLKKEGIPYCAMAKACDMPSANFYYYLKNNSFPYERRKRMAFILSDKYKEIL